MPRTEYRKKYNKARREQSKERAKIEWDEELIKDLSEAIGVARGMTLKNNVIDLADKIGYTLPKKKMSESEWLDEQIRKAKHKRKKKKKQ